MTERGERKMVEVKWSSNGIIRNDNTNVFDVRTFFLNFVRAVPTRTGLRCYSRHYYQTILISWLCVSRRKCSNYEHIAASKNIPNDMETKQTNFILTYCREAIASDTYRTVNELEMVLPLLLQFLRRLHLFSCPMMSTACTVLLAPFVRQSGARDLPLLW